MPYKQFLVVALIVTQIFTPLGFVFAQSNAAERAQLEAELVQIEAEIKLKELELKNQKKQSGSIKKDLTILQSEIAAKKLDIQKKNLLLTRLSGQITEKVSVIQSLNNELSREKQSLARLLRKQYQLEQFSLTEILLTGKTFSEFFVDIYAFSDLKQALTHSFQKIRTVQQQTAIEKQNLEDKKQEENIVKVALEKDKKKVEVIHKEKDVLLKTSVSKEKIVEQTIKDRKAKAATIRARLFSLIEVKGGGIAFGEAVRLAKEAGELTGVRPAFILAILKQETNIGSNVGRCYMNDASTGNGQTLSGKPVSGVMKLSRDVGPFIDLMEKLGKDYKTTPVSCPIAGGGYGGAMGPSQFIPSTWKMFESKVAGKTGSSTGNPWIPLHAFTATALYVANLGATAQTYDSERNAACKYYSGRACGSSGVRNAFYGNSVMSYANGFTDDIELIDEN